MRSIKEQKRVIDLATPGPWYFEVPSGENNSCYCSDENMTWIDDTGNSANNVELISAASVDYKQLLDWAERAISILKTHRDKCKTDGATSFCYTSDPIVFEAWSLLKELPEE